MVQRVVYELVESGYKSSGYERNDLGMKRLDTLSSAFPHNSSQLEYGILSSFTTKLYIFLVESLYSVVSRR